MKNYILNWLCANPKGFPTLQPHSNAHQTTRPPSICIQQSMNSIRISTPHVINNIKLTSRYVPISRFYGIEGRSRSSGIRGVSIRKMRKRAPTLHYIQE